MVITIKHNKIQSENRHGQTISWLVIVSLPISVALVTNTWEKKKKKRLIRVTCQLVLNYSSGKLRPKNIFNIT